jgi:hypothetical protein
MTSTGPNAAARFCTTDYGILHRVMLEPALTKKSCSGFDQARVRLVDRSQVSVDLRNFVWKLTSLLKKPADLQGDSGSDGLAGRTDR